MLIATMLMDYILSYRHNSCRNERKYLEDNLRRYHALMEANPSELEQYNEMEIH